MNGKLVLVLAAAGTFLLAGWIVSKQRAARLTAEWAAHQLAWQSEKAELEAALARARDRTPVVSVPVDVLTAAPAAPPSRLSPEEIIARLQSLRLAPGRKGGTILRQAVYWLEELAQAGPAAGPAIREFLARYEDIEWDGSQLPDRGNREWTLEFTLPPSLRFGLFELLRRTGGADAAPILAASLARTGRGVEVAYLARVLQQMAPQQYREQAVTVARTLLAGPAPANPSSLFDRNHRDHLFGVLAFLGDSGYVGEAQAQLVRADSQLDRSALRYLQQTLGASAVPIAAQAYQNPLLTNSATKEPLARLALSFVGTDAQANEFYQRTINDPSLNRSDRKNLIEDLNQDGFPDRKNLTARDLPLIDNRLALIEHLAPGAMDDANAAAFKEAYKDLFNMRTRITSPPAAPGAGGLTKP